MTDRPWDAWDAGREHWQDILNARPIPPHRLQRHGRAPIPVRARLIWERDGEEWTDTHATDWVGLDVLVSIHDRRQRTRGVWLDAADVERR